MGKKNETALMEAPATPLASSADFGGKGLVVKGKNETSMNLARASMYQGTPTEEKLYGQHTRGTFLDTLEIRELGPKIQIMPVIPFATYAVWEKGNPAPVESWTDEKDVPPEYLEWNEENGKRIPPKAKEAINVVCCVVANGVLEPFPYLIVFKSTGLKAWSRTIQPLEARRGSIGKCPGLYELSGADDKNADGQDYKRLTARPAGDPPADVIELAKKIFNSQSHVQAAAATMANDGFDPEAE